MDTVESLRDRIKALELDAERQELWLLFRATGPDGRAVRRATALPTGDDSAGSIVSRHLDAVAIVGGLTWTDADRAALATVTAAAIAASEAEWSEFPIDSRNDVPNDAPRFPEEGD